MQKAISSFFFALLFWGAGLGFFVHCNSIEHEWRLDSEAIERGEATEIELTIVKKYVQEANSSDDSDERFIVLSGPGVEKESRYMTYDEFPRYHVGQKFDAFIVRENVRVPELDSTSPKAKWIFLVFGIVLGCVPMGFGGYELLSASDD